MEYGNIFDESMAFFIESELHSKLAAAYQGQGSEYQIAQQLFFEKMTEAAAAIAKTEEAVKEIEDIVIEYLGESQRIDFTIGFRFGMMFYRDFESLFSKKNGGV